MSDAAVLVTRSYRRLQAIDINEQPSESEMTHGLAVMSEMVNGWSANGVTAETFTLVGDVVSGSALVRNLTSSARSLLIGLNVEGTGIPDGASVVEVVADRQFRLSAPATADAGAGTLTFEFLPMPVKYEGALVALLAVRLSEDVGKPVSAKLAMDAVDGWASILAGYIPDRKAAFDRALAAPAGAWDINQGWII